MQRGLTRAPPIPRCARAERCPAAIPYGSTDSSRVLASGPAKSWKNHQGMPLVPLMTTVFGPSSGRSSGASAGKSCAFTVSTMKSWMPSSAGEPARGRLVRMEPPCSTLKPDCRKASSVAPRATMDTRHPARSNASPNHAPMAPAPTIATEGVHNGWSLYRTPPAALWGRA